MMIHTYIYVMFLLLLNMVIFDAFFFFFQRIEIERMGRTMFSLFFFWGGGGGKG